MNLSLVNESGKNLKILKLNNIINISKKKQKRKNLKKELKIATWNIRTLYKPGALKTLISELKRYKIDIAALQEIRWKGTDIFKTNDYTFFYSGNDEHHTLGTAFAIKNDIIHHVKNFKGINKRLCRIRLEGNFFNLTILCAHAPTEETNDIEKDTFYDLLEKSYDEAPKNDIKIILGDMNAKIGKEKTFMPHIGKESLHIESNENGFRLIDFATSKNMIISSTCFPHKDIHKGTWKSPDNHTINQIDHTVIDARHSSNVRDVRTYRGADADSDHHLVIMKFRQRISKIGLVKGHRTRKLDLDKLKDLDVRKIFRETITESINSLENTENREESATIEKDWENLKNIMQKSAEEIIGFKEPHRKKVWFNEKCKDAINVRNHARAKLMQQATDHNRREYIFSRTNASHVCRTWKRKAKEDQIRHIEQNSINKRAREMYADIKDVRRGFQARAVAMQAVNEDLVTDPEKVLDLWANYFEDLLNKTTCLREMDADFSRTKKDISSEIYESEPQLNEIQTIISLLKNNKAPGEDLINAEILKYGGNALVEKIFYLILKIWRHEKMPENWNSALIFPIHKKGSKLIFSNYRGISLLNVTYKILSKLIAKRLEPYLESCLGEYQAGFRKGMSTVDQIFSVKCLTEKFYEYNQSLHQIFIDYKQAYDSVNRNFLYKTLNEMKIPEKIVRLIKMTLKNTKSRILIAGKNSKEFQISSGLRQGDALSCMLFNITLEAVIRKTQQETEEISFEKDAQLLGYADDIAILTKKVESLQENVRKISQESLEAGLIINESKTKYLVTSRCKENILPYLQVYRYCFETISSFKYLGITLTDNNDNSLEIKERIKPEIKPTLV